MKNIFKSSKFKKSIIGASLAFVSLFSFNFMPISVISNKIVSAAKYEATETKITENTSSNQIQATELVSNLKEYFSDSSTELNLTEYYNKKYEDLLIAKSEEFLTYAYNNDGNDETTFAATLGSHATLKDYYKTSNSTFLDFLMRFVNTLSIYSNYPMIDSENNQFDKLAVFYNEFENYLYGTTDTITSFEQDKDSESTSTNFYELSFSYRKVKAKIDEEIKKSIAIVSYDGSNDNKVAAIIADKAPSKSDYKYGSNYIIDNKPYFELAANSSNFDNSNPFDYMRKPGNNTDWFKLQTFPYETNTNGSLVVYVKTDNNISSSEKSTYDFLGYKTVDASVITEDHSAGFNNYYPVPYSSTNRVYFEFLYNELIESNKISNSITFDNFVNIFIKSNNANVSESILYLKYNSNCYKNKIYVASQDDYNTLISTYQSYKFINYVNNSEFVNSNNEKDYVKINNTTLDQTYQINTVGNITLYFKQQIIEYTTDNVIYLTDDQGNFIYESELVLDIEYEKSSGKKNIYILDESENASENKIYQSLGYTVIDTPTIDYVEIEKTDKNYNEKLKLYYKYADTNKVFAKNLLTLTTGETPEAKNAVYILSSSVESNLSDVCKANNFIPLSKDELTSGNFVKINQGDPIYSTTYELYYKYDLSLNSKTENKIFEYTSSSTSEFNPFYKTDSGYNLENYEKIKKEDPKFKQGYDLYYKKTTKTESITTPKNTIYTITTKATSGITFSANSYYAISFYVNTTGANISASLELEDSNKYLSDAKITNISTNGNWVKYYLFIATNTLQESKVKLILSMGTKNGIYGSDDLVNLSGSVLFDEVKIYKINETDFNKKTINNDNVYVDFENKKVDTLNNKNIVNFENTFNAKEKYQNDLIVENWNNIFNFETIDDSILSNIEENGGELQNINIDNIDGFNNIFDLTNADDLWHYYIGRDVSGKNNSELLDAYRQAYKDLKASISLVSESEEKSPVEEPEDESEPETEALADEKEESSTENSNQTVENPIVSNTFTKDNKILKIENSSASMPLGVVSRPFTLETSQCYKITLYIYSPDENATATIKVISNLLTAQNNEYGIELSGGASDISAFLKKDDDKTVNEYRWLPVEFYIQGNILSDQQCQLVLLADENSTIYFDNINIEKITTAKFTDTSASTRIYKLSLTNSSTALTKLITNGFFNDASVTELDKDSNLPKPAQKWTITTDAAQDYVTAGIISSNNNEFIVDYNNNMAVNDKLATNMYAINVKPEKQANHKIYTGSSFSLSANSVYKITFEYYYSENLFSGDIISNLYYSSYKPENKISSIRATAQNANQWNSVTFYVATGTSSVSSVLELGVEYAEGTVFFRNVYATTITKTLDQIRSEYASNNDNKLTIEDDHINLVDYSTYSFSMNKEENEDGIIESTEFKTNSANTTTATTGKVGVLIADYFTETKTTEKTFIVDNTTYYIYDNLDGDPEVYKYSIYNNTTLDQNEKLDKINNKSFVIENGKVIIGTGNNETEYDIVEKSISKFNYHFNDDLKLGNATFGNSELTNNQSQNVLVLNNDNDTDYTEIESNYKMSLSSSSYYALKFYVKTSDFEKDNFGLSIKVSATKLDINWKEDLINTTKVDSDLHKNDDGFVCYQLLIDTKKTSYSDLIIKFNLGTASNTGKGYAIISKVELTKLSSKDEFEHYSNLFIDEDDDSTIKTTSGSESSASNDQHSHSTSEVTWSTFFYIFSSLLLFIALVIAMVAIVLKKHPLKLKKATFENDNFDIEISSKTKNKINDEQDKNSEGGIE